MRVYVLSFFGLVLFAVAAGVLFADSKQLAAQDGSISADAGPFESKPFEEIDVMKSAFPNTPKGCGQKAAFFVVGSGMYGKGTKIEDVSAQAKIFSPIVEDVYKKIDKLGVVEATVKNMEDYIDCVNGSEKKKDTKRAKETVDLHETCVRVTEFALDVVGSIKSRRSQEGVLAVYESKTVDFTGTPYEKIENADEFLVKKIYKMAENGSYDSAVFSANMIAIGCYMNR